MFDLCGPYQVGSESILFWGVGLVIGQKIQKKTLGNLSFGLHWARSI